MSTIECNVTYNVIAAVSKNRGIGYKGDLPWRLKKEMEFFKQKTSQVIHHGTQNAVIMGRCTWQSIPDKYKPLKGRLNVVISKTLDCVPEGVLLYPKLTDALKALSLNNHVEKLWVIGGSSLYSEALKDKNCKHLFITKINQEFLCDTFFPEIDPKEFEETKEFDVPEEIQEENSIRFEFKVFKRI